MIIQKQWNNLEKHAKKCIEQEIVPGMSIALLTHHEKRVLHLGYRQLVPTQIENDEQTIWDLASLTKVVATTTCILKCIEQGKFNLKTKVCEIIPAFVNSEISIFHCLTHTSGLPSDIPNYKVMTKNRMLKFIHSAQPICTPGTEVIYSDINFILLGQVIDVCTGSFKNFAKRELFDPLAMKSTCFNPKADSIDTFASYENNIERGGVIRGVVHDGKAFKLGGISGHAGLFSTINDLSNFVTMLLNDGIYNDTRILSPSSIDLLKKCRTVNLNEKRTLGWVISDQNYDMGDYYSDCALFHTGFSGGSIYIDFDRSLGLLCMTNRIHPSRENTKIFQERNNIHNLAIQCVLENEF
ncbi:serine hydrolase domain-containing protein [Anaerorhabdus sp.]|uniref:serine hydrolase domain-containing protein n=1 Tax=Anaerorhabdus sp. TaxID=1872524 RepID=UPI002B2196C5|nr:serine hydrolase domain-containing protein [Anaerorhabdus sp.]MEA4875242.1 serine hydrolase domain-containing protein [Anaerorhabdus sp.]